MCAHISLFHGTENILAAAYLRGAEQGPSHQISLSFKAQELYTLLQPPLFMTGEATFVGSYMTAGFIFSSGGAWLSARPLQCLVQRDNEAKRAVFPTYIGKCYCNGSLHLLNLEEIMQKTLVPNSRLFCLYKNMARSGSPASSPEHSSSFRVFGHLGSRFPAKIRFNLNQSTFLPKWRIVVSSPVCVDFFLIINPAELYFLCI